MEKLVTTLSELQLTSEYISIEIKEIECLLTKLWESMKMHQRSIIAIGIKALEIEKLKQEEKNLFNTLQGRVTKLHLSITTLESLRIVFQNLDSSDENKSCDLDEEKLNKFKSQMKLFGVGFEAHCLESRVCRAKVLFSKNEFISFNYNFVDNTYDLQLMEPNHKYFDEIRKLLRESGDIVGFLRGARTAKIF